MLKFLVDESAGRKVASMLKERGYDATYVGDINLGAEDEEVLDISQKEKRIIVSMDKDFGELVFRFKKSVYGIILLRLKDESSKNKIRSVLNVLKGFKGQLGGNFVVLSEGRIRIRRLYF